MSLSPFLVCDWIKYVVCRAIFQLGSTGPAPSTGQRVNSFKPAELNYKSITETFLRYSQLQGPLTSNTLRSWIELRAGVINLFITPRSRIDCLPFRPEEWAVFLNLPRRPSPAAILRQRCGTAPGGEFCLHSLTAICRQIARRRRAVHHSFPLCPRPGTGSGIIL